MLSNRIELLGCIYIIMEPCQESYVFANFFREKFDDCNNFVLRKKNRFGSERKVFTSRIDRIIYSFEGKMSISQTRKLNCSKNKRIFPPSAQYKLEPAKNSFILRPKLTISLHKIKALTKPN